MQNCKLQLRIKNGFSNSSTKIEKSNNTSNNNNNNNDDSGYKDIKINIIFKNKERNLNMIGENKYYT